MPLNFVTLKRQFEESLGWSDSPAAGAPQECITCLSLKSQLHAAIASCVTNTSLGGHCRRARDRSGGTRQMTWRCGCAGRTAAAVAAAADADTYYQAHMKATTKECTPAAAVASSSSAAVPGVASAASGGGPFPMSGRAAFDAPPGNACIADSPRAQSTAAGDPRVVRQCRRMRHAAPAGPGAAACRSCVRV